MQVEKTFFIGLALLACIGIVKATAPDCTVDLPGNYISIPEDTPINTTLFTITITDTDPDEEITIHIKNSALVWLSVGPEESFSPPRDVLVYVREALDREDENDGTHKLKFEISDKVENTVTVNIDLYLTDVNDNKPSFDGLPYSWNIHENATDDPSTQFKQITASDPDNGENGTVIYRMEPATQSETVSTVYKKTFEMNEANGDVTLKKPLDYELNSYYQFTVIAEDKGTPPLNNTAVFIIRVLDVQDTPPFFTGIPYRGELEEENEEEVTSVLSVTAVDGDPGIPNKIRYNITSGNCPDLFEISDDGTVSTTRRIDRDDGVVREQGNICQLQIQAEEEDENPSEQYGETTTTTTVTITVLDVNDNIPEFNGNDAIFNTSVQENTPAGSPITMEHLSVKDIDQGINGSMNLYMTFENGTNITDFEVRPSRVIGEAPLMIWIMNNNLLDREVREDITLKIIAKEEANSSHIATATVVLNIEDINDCDPVFADESYEFDIDESPDSGFVVGNITATDEDSGEFGNVSYNLFGGNGRFVVDKYSGEISVNCSECSDQLDREKIDTFYLTFTATDGGGRTRAVPVEIHLNDINDNNPTFLRSSYQEVLDEDNPYPDLIVTVQATDADLGDNAEVTYTIAFVVGSDESQFNISEEEGSICLIEQLDYENLIDTEGLVTLGVMATDGGTPSLNSTVNVTIKVQDVNDNAPVFNLTTYFGAIMENETSPAEVTLDEEIAATDKDGTDRNSQFRYFITAGSFDQFTINATSGNVAVQVGKSLDRDQRPAYNLTIEAIDQGYPSNTGTTTLSVSIVDVNDKYPQFTQSQYATSVLELDPKINVFTVVAEDRDDDPDLNYTVHDVSGTTEDGVIVNKTEIAHYFEIDNVTGIVSASNQTDRETAKHIYLTIKVEDKNAYHPKPQTATATLTIELLDVNDNDPVFEQELYTVNVSENADDGPIIATIQATDADENRTIMYTIFEDGYPFEIDDMSGALSKKGKIDRETNATMEFKVVATDNGVPPRNSTVSIHIIVLDFNDNPPIFPNSSYKISLYENATVNTIVTNVTATDIDEGRNSEIIYSIENEADFSIDNKTGVIRVATGLDREKKSEYSFRVIAKDNPENPAHQKSSHTQVIIQIEDVNDNDPEFEQTQYTVEIREDTAPDRIILYVTATDADEDKTLEYNIANDTDLFLIDTSTNVGQMKVNTSLKSYTGSYLFVVIAKDSGGREGNATVNVTVTDVNLNPPEIINLPDNHTLKIYECARIGTQVYKFNYTDADKGKNADAYFNLSKIQAEDNVLEVFEMRLNGSLITKTVFDVKVQTSYRFQISATDRGDPALSSEKTTIEVKVLDVDDHAPSFYESNKSFAIEENKDPGSFVGRLTAYDEDLNSVQCFYILHAVQPNPHNYYVYEDTENTCLILPLNRSVSLNSHNCKDGEKEVSDFIVDNKSGNITTNRSFDREDETKLTFKVEVKDCSEAVDLDSSCDNETKHQQNHMPNQTIVVTVVDVDDNPPVFIQDMITLGIRRVTEVGILLPLSLKSDNHVTDEDTPANGIEIWKFKINGEIEAGPGLESIETKSGTELCDDEIKHIFCVSTNGSVINNKYFSEDVSGFFLVPVIVSDGAGNDTAKIKIFLIGDTQILRMTLFGNKEEVQAKREEMLQAFSDITGHTFVYDWIEDHKTPNGDVDTIKSDLYFHIVEQDTDRILSAEEGIKLVDTFNKLILPVKEEYTVIQIAARLQGSDDDTSINTSYVLGAVIAALGVTVCIMIFVIFSTRSSYRRKLKAATVTSHAGKNLDKKESTAHIPGSNMYSKKSNPLLNADLPMKSDTYDNISLNSNNSLDSNDVDTARADEVEYDRIEEKEVTLDMYTEDGMFATSEESPLDAALRLHEQHHTAKQDEAKPPQHMAFINEVFVGELESTEI